ncbi:ABC transporter permease [Peribacillus sp. SCS-26]|uniref:ABC transporter permease n=1 Tax=Paraperibacillus marinus TaxID=3115295 RepID=UPI0039068109
MNIFIIALNEAKRDIWDIRTLIFKLCFPVVLILVLGTALSATFSETLSVGELRLLYTFTSKGSPQETGFREFIKGAEAAGVKVEEAKQGQDGRHEVKENDWDGYAEVGANGIQLYVNDKNSINGSMLQGMLSSFAGAHSAHAVIAAHALGSAEAAAAVSGRPVIEEKRLLPHKQAGSMDYYAVVITTMIALYGALSASSMLVGERRRNTAVRLLASPVRKSEIFIGKILGNILTNILCVVLVIAMSMIFFNAYWGEHPGLIALILLTEVILAVSLGIGMSYIFKSSTKPGAIIMMFIQLASFFGGAYFKIEDPEGVFKVITQLSPLTWVNIALNKIIYLGDLAAAVPVISLNIGISVLFLGIAAVSLQRREGL